MRNRFPGSGIPFLYIKDLPQHKFCLPESVRSATLIEWAGVNGIASIQNIEKADQIVPLILQRGLNLFLASIFIAGIVAAGMSTIDGILVTTTGAVTRDILSEDHQQECHRRERYEAV